MLTTPGSNGPGQQDAPPSPVAAGPAPSAAVKRDIVATLGEHALLLPSLINRGLEANDRAKYLLTLFQAARAHADDPGAPFATMREERLAAGVADSELDNVVGRARRVGDGIYLIPTAGALREQLVNAVAEMVAPLDGAGSNGYPARLDRLARGQPRLEADLVPGDYVDALSRAERVRGDSFHLLIMDAHRELNRLQADLATESVDGASVYNLADDDRPLVAAFMAGLHSTAAVKLDHPGLGTTATRTGRRLLLQNDIGETQAHIVIITIEELVATVTFTDVHRQRLQFSQALLDRFPVKWSAGAGDRGGPAVGAYKLAVGRFAAPDRRAMLDFLHHVGSRLPFLIDWNRARKQLVPLVGTAEAPAVLRWAADAGVGHVAFLRLGGQRLIYDAVELASKVPSRYGERLVDTLGREATLDLVHFALRAASCGLRGGKSPQLIRDELRVEVLHHVHAAQSTLLVAAADHASLIVETAQALWTGVVGLSSPDGSGFLSRASGRAAGWERRADEILGEMRLRAHGVEDGETVVRLVGTGDDAIDDLEEAMFLLTLLPSEATAVARPVLAATAALAVAGSKQYLKAATISATLTDALVSDELEDFLVAVDTVGQLESQADVADRVARSTLLEEAPDFRSLYVADSISRAVEDATDALKHAARQLRDYVLDAVSAR